MRVIVLGAGAIGCWVGANAVRNGAQVMLVGRAPLMREMAMQGLVVDLPDGNQWVLRTPLASTEISAEAAALADAVFICTKAHALDEAIAQLQAAGLNKRAWLVPFQNGLGSEERLAQAFGGQRVLAATTTTPVSLVSPSRIKVESLSGGVGVAAVDRKLWSGDMERSAAAVRKLVGGEVYTDYEAMKWSKLLLNIIGNASGAILDMPLSELYRDKRMLNLEFAMLREALAVMDKRKLLPVDLPGASAAKLAKALRKYPDWALRLLLKPRFIKGRGAKKPSLHFDVAQPNGKSEIEYLNGQVVAWGQELEIPVPVNSGLTRVMLDLVQGRERADDWRGQREKLLAVCGVGNGKSVGQ
jgi:2-dehydropantoate 2-reductase